MTNEIISVALAKYLIMWIDELRETDVGTVSRSNFLRKIILDAYEEARKE